MDYSKKTVLVTGGTGHLGKAICTAFAKNGAHVLVNGRSTSSVENLVQDLNHAGYSATCAAFDVCSDSETETFMASVSQLDILVNNAYSGGSGSVEVAAAQDYRDSLEVSLIATQRLFKAALPLLRKSYNKFGDASVLNVSSMYGLVAPRIQNYMNKSSANPPFYGAAKAGLIQWSQYAAAEFASEGIRINSISPGAFPSPTSQKNTLLMNNLLDHIPMRRFGKPQEIANPILFLCSPMASYITGTNLVVDGGWTSW